MPEGGVLNTEGGVLNTEGILGGKGGDGNYKHRSRMQEMVYPSHR